jgi:hypothetical protein
MTKSTNRTKQQGDSWNECLSGAKNIRAVGVWHREECLSGAKNIRAVGVWHREECLSGAKNIHAVGVWHREECLSGAKNIRAVGVSLLRSESEMTKSTNRTKQQGDS